MSYEHRLSAKLCVYIYRLLSLLLNKFDLLGIFSICYPIRFECWCMQPIREVHVIRHTCVEHTYREPHTMSVTGTFAIV